MLYKVRQIAPKQKEWWKDAEPARVDCFPWGAAGKIDYRPATCAYLAADGEALLVFMESDETNLRAETKGFGKVHTDSCMEFFVSPDPASPRYLNYEFNPAGGMHLAIGTSRYDRENLPMENYRDLFQVKTTAHDKGWNLRFCIPLLFLKRFFPALELKPGRNMRGNFYKCGDETGRPHYGCWSPIDLPKPDFHCPAFFGTLTLL